ncbi:MULTISPECIES: response regulator transcription factor [Streptomyces]|uniref:Two component transcriptional regulator, LuxR family n=1 Tax=Streptomyces pini TaxID=1520580 RepID=A0A1I4BNM8_9ACTN|nr:response regulator transcription factor [Streptomyces pini]SFK69797.1 two component transcriptional regulator, LuxR family [Streptomyces pini]
MTIRIMVADDHVLFLEALAEALDRVEDFDVVGAACESGELLPTAQRVSPSVLVVGGGMSGPGGLCQVAELTRRVPSCGITLIVVEPTRSHVTRAVEAGVLGIVPKQAKLPNLIGAIRGVAAGCVTVDPCLLNAPGPGNRCLNDREVEILRLTATGASIKEIAQELYLASGTVRNLTSAAIRKLQGRNRFDAARIALERGWL